MGEPEHAISEMHVNGIRDQKEPEPIRCPKCEGEPRGGIKCPHCGYEHVKSKRHVIMEDGRMMEVDGHPIKPRHVRRAANTAKWAKLYWGYRKNKVKATFNEMEGYFTHLYGYHPPRDLPLMPKKQRMVCDGLIASARVPKIIYVRLS